ncbi:cation:proton antiporter domain-containing protein [Streptomyces sp. NPDC054834]
MPDVSFANLFAVTLVALLAPFLLGLVPRLRIPAVVLEIVAGIVLGSSGLGWIKADLPVQIVSLLGLAFLLFLAGLEIDVHRLRGPLLGSALLGYGITLVLGVAAGLAFGAAGWVHSPLLIAVTLSATSLGLVVPVLQDAECAGLLSVLLFPVSALALLRDRTLSPEAHAPMDPHGMGEAM